MKTSCRFFVAKMLSENLIFSRKSEIFTNIWHFFKNCQVVSLCSTVHCCNLSLCYLLSLSSTQLQARHMIFADLARTQGAWSLIISLKWPLQRFCLRGGSAVRFALHPDWCHWWCVVQGSQVNLVHLICVRTTCIGLVSANLCRGCCVCRGSFNICMNRSTLHVSTQWLCYKPSSLENPLGCCWRINIDWLIELRVGNQSINEEQILRFFDNKFKYIEV